MKFERLEIDGLVLVHPERHADERGYFARTYCRQAFGEQGMADCSLQVSLSHNAKRGTLRGMHYQCAPHGETKLVRCSRGAVYDVAVDLRPQSLTCGRWFGVELSAANGIAFYIPAGFAHGFVTLSDETDLIYQMAEPHVGAAAAGFKWDDPAVAIVWPMQPAVISSRDAALPNLAEARRAC